MEVQSSAGALLLLQLTWPAAAEHKVHLVKRKLGCSAISEGAGGTELDPLRYIKSKL